MGYVTMYVMPSLAVIVPSRCNVMINSEAFDRFLFQLFIQKWVGKTTFKKIHSKPIEGVWNDVSIANKAELEIKSIVLIIRIVHALLC